MEQHSHSPQCGHLNRERCVFVCVTTGQIMTTHNAFAATQAAVIHMVEMDRVEGQKKFRGTERRGADKDGGRVRQRERVCVRGGDRR